VANKTPRPRCRNPEGWAVSALLLPDKSVYVHAFLGAALTAKQDEHTKSRKDVHSRVSLNRVKPANAREVSTPEYDASDEFAEHGRLTRPNREVSAEFGGRQDDR
jgi:hypothetical protein